MTKANNFNDRANHVIDWDALRLSDGQFPNISYISKFGRNIAVGTSYELVSLGGIYRTPQVSGATKVRVKAGDALDASDGTGAQEITIIGLNTLGEEKIEAIPTNGTSAGADSVNEYIRIYRAFVSKSGRYTIDLIGGSHEAEIVVENAAGTDDWLTIANGDLPRGQTEIGCYSVPKGKCAFVSSVYVNVDSNKTAEAILMQRQGILKTAAPYDAARVVAQASGLTGFLDFKLDVPIGPIPELTDIFVATKVALTSAEVDVHFEVIKVDME